MLSKLIRNSWESFANNDMEQYQGGFSAGIGITDQSAVSRNFREVLVNTDLKEREPQTPQCGLRTSQEQLKRKICSNIVITSKEHGLEKIE